MHGWLIISISLSTQYKCIDHKLTLREAIIKKSEFYPFLRFYFKVIKKKSQRVRKKLPKWKRKRKGLKWSPHQRGAVAGDQDYDILQYKVREIPMKIALGKKSVD